MQSSESQIYELQTELREKEQLIRELNKTILEQRDYLDSKNTHDNSQSMNSFDSRLGSSTATRRKRNYKDSSPENEQENEDAETIEGLKEDIRQLLNEYRLLEKQKEASDNKCEELLQKNDDMIKEIMNMEHVIEDQDTQIINMREKLQNQLKALHQNKAYEKQLDYMKSNLNPALDITETDLNKSANISQQINLENFKAGKIGNRDTKKNKKKFDKKALNDVLNLSYQLINPEGDRREQSIIEERMCMRKARGQSPFSRVSELVPLNARNRPGNNTGSTSAEDDSKALNGGPSFGRNRLASTGKSIPCFPMNFK